MPQERMISILTLVVCSATVAILIWLGGCNTMEGAGEDIQEAGESIEDAAD